jgi:hypothetical protein
MITIQCRLDIFLVELFFLFKDAGIDPAAQESADGNIGQHAPGYGADRVSTKRRCSRPTSAG